MTEFDWFLKAIKRQLPDVRVDVDAPVAGVAGSTFARLAAGAHVVLVEWRPRAGFGIVAGGEGGYGEGPDEVTSDRGEAASRVLALLQHGGITLPPRHVMLRELRLAAGLSQEVVAGRLGVGQAAVSKVERRRDVGLSTLREYVRALGGSLELRAHVGDEDFVLAQFDGG